MEVEEVQSPGALQPLLPHPVRGGEEGHEAGERGDHPAQQTEQLQQVSRLERYFSLTLVSVPDIVWVLGKFEGSDSTL